MILLQVADLKFGYAGDTLFEKVTFAIESGDRVCIVAPNGAGKSTLLRLIAHELEPDAGTAVIKRDTKVAYYRQSHEVAAEGDVLGAFLSGFKEIVELRAELSRVQHEAASGSTRSLSALADITDRYHIARGDELERHVSMLAQKLGFSERDLSRPVSSLSGGERGRLNLGVVLAQEADLLMLDEPTNHLDLDTITWLEDFLLSYRGGVIVVSHDRTFLDRVCPKTLELGSRDVRIYPMKYSDYAIAREDDLARERALLERHQAFIDKTEDFIRKNIAGQKTKQAQSRRKMLEKLDRVDRPEDVWAAAEKIAFRFSPAARSGDIVLDCQDLAASRGGRVLFSGVELLVRRGERIGIVGPNGSGKSTLLKLLAGRGRLMNHEARAPEGRTVDEDTGKIKRGTNLQQGYFDQHLGEVNPNLIATEEIRTVRGDFTTEAARQYLARFRFYGDDPLRVVSGYSGGEKSRLALAKLLLEPRNLLFLDEPTNHLDIPAAEILEEAIGGFEGTVLLVSHDRRFLEKTATRIISVRDGKIDIYPGGFRDYVAAHAPKEEWPPRDQQRKKQSAPPPPPKDDRREPVPHGDAAGRAAFEAQKNATREKERKKRRIVELEQTIASGEKELTRLREELREDPKGNWERVAQLAKAEQALVKRVDAMMSEWAELSEDKS